MSSADSWRELALPHDDVDSFEAFVLFLPEILITNVLVGDKRPHAVDDISKYNFIHIVPTNRL
jgi:hypothetical protein